MQCKNDFTSPIRWDPFQCNTRLSLTLLKGRIRALHACMGTQGWGDGRGGVDTYLYASFLSSSLCLCLPNRSGYGYQADTRAALGSTYLFPKMAPLCFFPFLFSFSNQSNPDSQRFTATRRSALCLSIYKLGYRDNSLTGETTGQTIARVCSTTPADSRANETQGSFVPSEVETLSWRSQ